LEDLETCDAPCCNARAKNPPLNDVDEFMKVQGFIGGGAWLKEVRVEIRDPANRLLLEVGELRKPKCRKGRSRQTIRDDHAGAVQ
jgi:hypothetical protein